MTPREAFKLGFLQKCAADGLSTDETLECIRHAKSMVKDATITDWPGYALTAALAGPPLLGVLGGATLSDATTRNYDTDEAKTREELAEYKRAVKAMKAMRLKQQQQLS